MVLVAIIKTLLFKQEQLMKSQCADRPFLTTAQAGSAESANGALYTIVKDVRACELRTDHHREIDTLATF